MMYKNKNKNIYYSNQWAHNRGKQIAYIDYCHWRQLYIYIYKILLTIGKIGTFDSILITFHTEAVSLQTLRLNEQISVQ
jgi:hypothetical protein